MNRKSFAAALFSSAALAAVWIVGCGDDEVFRTADAGGFDSGGTVEAGPNPQTDGGDGSTGPGCGAPTGLPQRLLLSMNNSTTSELAAFNVADKKVDGRLTYKGFIGVTSAQSSDPYLLEEATDIVARLDAKRPWEIVSTWNVAGDDRKDGGPNAQPVAIVVPDCKSGYVLRYSSNKIAVIDTTKVADGGPPESYIDLGSLLQPADPDGSLEVTNALHVPSKKRIYVLLGNIDFTKFTPAFDLLCSATKPSIVAIDTMTGKLVSLNGTAPGGGIALGGYNPPLGASLAYDAARDRLLVLEGGCNADIAGTAGPMQQRRIEEVDLATGSVKALLSLDNKDFPTGLVYVDGNRALVTFAGPSFGSLGSAYFWDPSQTALGAMIPGGLDYSAYDGKGNLVGLRVTKVDGGAGPLQVVSVPFTDAGTVDAAAATKLGENPFLMNAGNLGGVEMWPRP